MDAAMRNPLLALRESSLLAPLAFGNLVLERLAAAAPDEAMLVVPPALLAAGSPRMRALAELAGDVAHDLPTRKRAAFLADVLPADAVWSLAAGGAPYYAALADLRERSPEPAGLDRALEGEALTLCRAAQQSGSRTLAADLKGFRPTDVYLVLAFGGAECGGAVFNNAFDRQLSPRLKPGGLAPLLARTQNWKLYEFTEQALLAGRFERLLSLAGAEAISNLAIGIDDVSRAAEVAEIAGVSRHAVLDGLLARKIAAECSRVQDRNASTWYRLLAARLLRAGVDSAGLRQAGEPYEPLLASSDAIDLRVLFDPANRCVERYFFWDDDDGVQSFENFLRQYDRDAAWKIERQPGFVHLTGHGAAGRTVEIYANVPIDIRLAANRGREGEALRRQAQISAELAQRNLMPPILVQRGHVYHVEKTLAFVTPAAKLVVLGSCRGVPEIRHVIESSHEAQVIATRGVGAMQINDAILKGLNVRLLSAAGEIRWSDFWREQQARAGKSAVFRNYLTPDRDEAAAFLRAYYMALDAAGPR